MSSRSVPDFKKSPFLEIPTQQVDIRKTAAPGGVTYLQSAVPLQAHPFRMTARLLHWAEHQPDTVFLAQKDGSGRWQSITYRETLQQVRDLGQGLLHQGVTAERPLAIVADNGIEHALLALAAWHIGVPHCTLNPAYLNKSKDYTKLRHSLELLSPGLILVEDGQQFAAALPELSATVVAISNAANGKANYFSFSEMSQSTATEAVDSAFERIRPDTIAKILFTSGSTGLPKGVINTHGNITTNWQQIVQVFPFMADGFELIDWLPWSHTFGGNHNLGLTLYNGGTMYIDDGNPSPEGVKKTVENLRKRRPTIYFNVPKGFEELLPHLREDAALREQFFSRLKLLFYAGAGMAQHVWDALEELAWQTTGKRVLIATGLGCTEAGPSALFNTHFGSFAGMLGVPVPGLELKLAPVAGKLEARYRGGNITPGYWRNPEATAAAFDEEGFYRTGDALKFVNPDDPNEGLIFDGRLAEDFKLDTGTWVSVGSLRTRFIEAGKGLVQDVVITGHDRAYIGALVFPEAGFLRSQLGIRAAPPEQLSREPALLQALQEVLEAFALQNTGSSTLVRKALIAPFTPAPEKGELTDKGTINQRAVLTNRAQYIRLLYTEQADDRVLSVQHKMSKTT